ncbi:MAG: 50S ribosomal protein L11 methyltransferase [Oscillospiraceae bacterium]|jgi:ribosomal protein L11 methyltransferase|nr:50S ribosomal protein L11 methyltransferase [Oscillospiraceae bacterium]
MDWIEVSIQTKREGIDPVCARLIAMGVEGMQIEDFDDFQDFLENNREYWDYVDEKLIESKRGVCAVKVYLSDNPAGRDTLSLLRREMKLLREALPGADLGSLEIKLGSVRESDWETAWKQYYKPTEIGERLLIVPQWEEIPQTDRAVFINNPGMSFGTGTHASTRLALEAEEKHIKTGDRLLDLGSGSGILCICGVLMGGGSAVAVDIDPNAAEITMRNAAANRVEDRITAYAGDILLDEGLLRKIFGKYDLILANIVADVIVRLPAIVRPMLSENGRFIASGIIEERLEEVLKTLEENGLSCAETRKAEGWASITMTLTGDGSR